MTENDISPYNLNPRNALDELKTYLRIPQYI